MTVVGSAGAGARGRWWSIGLSFSLRLQCNRNKLMTDLPTQHVLVVVVGGRVSYARQLSVTAK